MGREESSLPRLSSRESLEASDYLRESLKDVVKEAHHDHFTSHGVMGGDLWRPEEVLQTEIETAIRCLKDRTLSGRYAGRKALAVAIAALRYLDQYYRDDGRRAWAYPDEAAWEDGTPMGRPAPKAHQRSWPRGA